jgi:hypothetical protein
MSAASSIASALVRFGRPMTLRRNVLTGDVSSPVDVSVHGVSEGAQSQVPQPSATRLKVTFGNSEIAAAGWPGPPACYDQMIVDGQIVTIESVECRRLGTEILVFECMAT